MCQTKQTVIGSSQIKTITVAYILSCCWAEYLKNHVVRDVVKEEVEKAIKCRNGENGVFIYRCKKCGETVYQMLGCNSRLCSRCGKRYTDQWAKNLSKAMFKVPHRHFVMSIPSQLWPYLRENRKLWKPLMDSAIETCQDYFPKIMRNRNIKVGAIVILHPFGKDMKFYSHLHVIVTEGGFLGNKFVPREFFPALKFKKCWQYHASKNLQEAGVPNSLITELYEKYEGFYVWLHRAGRIKDPRDIAKYIGRYVRHPSIANNRIIHFDGKTVKFYYDVEDMDGNKTRQYVTMSVDEFITALIQHIPDRQFKMIRYYGTYARRSKRKYFNCVKQSSITNTIQDTLYMTGHKFKPICPKCGGMLNFVGYERIPPPGDYFHWDVPREKLADWIIMN